VAAVSLHAGKAPHRFLNIQKYYDKSRVEIPAQAAMSRLYFLHATELNGVTAVSKTGKNIYTKVPNRGGAGIQ